MAHRHAALQGNPGERSLVPAFHEIRAPALLARAVVWRLPERIAHRSFPVDLARVEIEAPDDERLFFSDAHSVLCTHGRRLCALMIGFAAAHSDRAKWRARRRATRWIIATNTRVQTKGTDVDLQQSCIRHSL